MTAINRDATKAAVQNWYDSLWDRHGRDGQTAAIMVPCFGDATFSLADLERCGAIGWAKHRGLLR